MVIHHFLSERSARRIQPKLRSQFDQSEALITLAKLFRRGRIGQSTQIPKCNLLSLGGTAGTRHIFASKTL